jgi:hypothetical protein
MRPNKARHVDDPCIVARVQIRQERPRQPHCRAEIDLEQPVEVGLADLLEGAGKRHARIVEEQIDAPVLGQDGLRQIRSRRTIRDVERVAGDADAWPAKQPPVSASPGSLMSASARWQPRVASDCAIERPMPLPAPVITAVRS